MAINMDRVPRSVTGMDQYGYIYCVRLPFVSNIVMGGLLQQEVVKVGHSISDPAGRLHEIMGVFNQLGIKEDLLQDVKEADTPETAIQKAKLHRNGCIIFIMKVAGTKKEIEKAEENIREVLEPSPLGNDFTDTFKSHFDKEKKAALEKHTGMTEWILADSEIIARLQMKFCSGQLYHYPRPDAIEQLTYQRRIPSWKDFCCQLIARCIECITNRQIRIPPSVIISFQPTGFQSEPIINNMVLIRGYEQKLFDISKALEQ